MWNSRKRLAKEQRIQALQSLEFYIPPAIPRDKVPKLESDLEGNLVLPDGPTYQRDRQLFNPAFQAFPQIIAYCEVPRDVRACLEFAKQNEIWAVVRSGGHSTAGYSVNGEMVIDVSRISYAAVDTQKKTARVGAGTTFGHLNADLDSYALHVPGGLCEDVCVAGFMQGGGYGLTSRQYGMNCDCVVAAKVMLADGSLVESDDSHDPDLFWAIRGGTGNNFGVLLEITYQLDDLGSLWGFEIDWPIGDAADALAELQSNFMKTGAKELGYLIILMYENDNPVLRMGGTYNGSESAGKSALSTLLKTKGACLRLSKTGTYLEMTRALTSTAKLPILLKEDKQSSYISRPLQKQDWQKIVDAFQRSPNSLSVLVIEPYGGRINAHKKDFNAFVHRDSDMDLFLDVFWRDDGEMPAAKSFLDSFMTLIDSDYSNGESYQNYPRSKQTNFADRFWKTNFERLLKTKEKYDPTHFFKFEQCIK